MLAGPKSTTPHQRIRRSLGDPRPKSTTAKVETTARQATPDVAMRWGLHGDDRYAADGTLSAATVAQPSQEPR